MIRFATAVLFLLFSLPAQCFGIHPPGVGAVLPAGAPGASCSDIPGTTMGPWASLAVPLSASNGGALTLIASGLPLVSSAPAVFTTLVHFDFAALSSPVALPTGCVSGYVAPAIVFTTLLANTGACQGSLLTIAPPLPGFAGVALFGQVFMYDNIRLAWASSNAFRMTFQP
jgi:hypothetical protein